MATRDDDHQPIDADDSVGDTMTDDHRPVTRVMTPPLSISNTSPNAPSPSLLAALSSDHERFRRRELLGRGGMGEVSLWHDQHLGRDVAIKRLLPDVDNATARARFLREARVQGQLEHPAIVPVYDVREDGDGGLSITMKRVRGHTLAQLLTEQRHAPAATASTTSRRLLSAFASVCLAVDFAHARGIVHRDLKPGNVMLGDFGEVYVLDWGLAKVLAEPGDDVVSDVVSPASMTQSGSMLGTLGYMAPEQLDDSLGPITPASDAYALGAILFELLAGEPLLSASSTTEMVHLTLHGVDARASVRAPWRHVAPELEAVCVAATSRNAQQRPGARAIYDAIEGFLEGDRDLQHRQQRAATHVAAANDALTNTALDVEQQRALAMRELGAALALEPDNAQAGRAVLQLLATPPVDVPAAVQAELDAVDQHQLVEGARVAAPLAVSWLLFLPFAFVMGVLDWRPLAAMSAGVVLVIAMTIANAKAARLSTTRQAITFALLGGLCATSSFVAGPLLMVPTLIATFVASLQAHPSRRMRQGIAVVGCCLFTVLVLLEWAGVSPQSYTFVDGTIVIRPVAVALPETATRVLVLVSMLGSTIATALFLARVRTSLATAQQRISLLGWHLRQLLPVDTRDTTRPQDP